LCSFIHLQSLLCEACKPDDSFALSPAGAVLNASRKGVAVCKHSRIQQGDAKERKEELSSSDLTAHLSFSSLETSAHHEVNFTPPSTHQPDARHKERTQRTLMKSYRSQNIEQEALHPVDEASNNASPSPPTLHS